MLQVLVKGFQGHAVSYRLSLTYHHLSVPQLPMPGGAWNLLQFENLVAVGYISLLPFLNTATLKKIKT